MPWDITTAKCQLCWVVGLMHDSGLPLAQEATARLEAPHTSCRRCLAQVATLRSFTVPPALTVGWVPTPLCSLYRVALPPPPLRLVPSRPVPSIAVPPHPALSCPYLCRNSQTLAWLGVYSCFCSWALGKSAAYKRLESSKQLNTCICIS